MLFTSPCDSIMMLSYRHSLLQFPSTIKNLSFTSNFSLHQPINLHNSKHFLRITLRIIFPQFLILLFKLGSTSKICQCQIENALLVIRINIVSLVLKPKTRVHSLSNLLIHPFYVSHREPL